MRIRKYLSFLTLIIIAGIATSCSSTYISNTPNIPLLSQKKEVQASAQAGSNGYMLQAAYAPAKNVGIIASGDFYTFRQDISNRLTLHYLVEAGAGGFLPVGKKATFELYAGYGHSFSVLPGARGKYNRVFIQPTFGLSSKYIDFGATSRFSWVGMYDYQSLESPAPSKQSQIFWEPALTTRIGYRYSKLALQVSGAIPFAKKANVIYDYLPLVFTVGIHINFSRAFDDQ